MKLTSIKDSATSKDVYDKINWKSIEYVYWKIPKKVLKAMELNELVVIGVGDMKDFHNPLAVIMHAEDYLAQLKSVQLPKKRLRRIQKLPKEELCQ